MEYVIEMRNITKMFPGIIANDDISLYVKKGEIHALLGKNGAGKSTLMSVLFGLYKPEKGQIIINGKEVFIKNPNDANRYGIGMVHQHFKLVHNFTVLENVILGAPDLPFLVVINTTPLEALDPYCAAAAAPLMTFKDSMSAGLISTNLLFPTEASPTWLPNAV